MTFAGIIDAIPLWAMALSVMLLLWLALCFRGLVAIVVTILCFIGLKSAGDPHLWFAIPVGLLVFGVLGAIAGLFSCGGCAFDVCCGPFAVLSCWTSVVSGKCLSPRVILCWFCFFNTSYHFFFTFTF